MAQKRMFSLKIVDTDAFLDMPQSTQNLYFHLGMRADDEGFIGNVKRIMKMIGSSEDDKKVLIAKRFILEFESGVVVIKHWKMNNYLQNDRIKETTYLQEKGQLYLKENGSYTLDKTQGIPMYTKCIHSIDKISIDLVENSIEEISNEQVASHTQKHKYGTYKNVLLTDEEYKKLLELENGQEAIQFLSEYIEMKGYKAKSHNLAIRKWVFTALKEQRLKEQKLGIKQKEIKPKDESGYNW